MLCKLLGDASQQELREATPPSVADDEEVGLLLLSGMDQRAGCVAID